MGCIMPKKSRRGDQSSDEVNDGRACPGNLQHMKRKDLQKLCKKLKLRAVGKNTELIERIQSYYHGLDLKELNRNEKDVDGGLENATTDCNEELLDTKEQSIQDIDVSIEMATKDNGKYPIVDHQDLNQENEENKVLSNSSLPKDWNWIAKWCVVDGVLKQDAKERWSLLQLIGGRVVLVDKKTRGHTDFVLEPTILPTPDEYEDNFVCGDCVRKNSQQLSGWVGLQRRNHMETPKSSLGKENIGPTKSDSTLLRQSFKRKRDEIFSSPGLDFIEVGDKPMKVQRLNNNTGPGCSPASPSVRRERGEDFQLPKNLLKPWKPKKTKSTPPREDPDFAQKVEKIISNLSPDEQLSLVFGARKPSVLHSPHAK